MLPIMPASRLALHWAPATDLFPPSQDCSFPAYFYTQPMATGPGFYDNLCPQSWQDGSAATFTLQDPHQQTFDCPGN